VTFGCVIFVANFELALNLKTAKAIGVTISSALLAEADQLVEG
jgi:hypothetical protein